MAMHPNSLANLKKGKRFGKGQATNLGGAPRGSRISNYLKKIAKETQSIEAPDGNRFNATNANAVCLALVSRAMTGDVKAIKIILETLKE